MTVPIDDLGDGFIEYNQFARELREMERRQDEAAKRTPQPIALDPDAEAELDVLFDRTNRH